MGHWCNSTSSWTCDPIPFVTCKPGTPTLTSAEPLGAKNSRPLRPFMSSRSYIQCPTSARPRRLVVRAGGAKRGSSGRHRKGGGGKQAKQAAAPQPSARSKPLLMAEFKADEVLLFDPVAAGRDALQVGRVAQRRIAGCFLGCCHACRPCAASCRRHRRRAASGSLAACLPGRPAPLRLGPCWVLPALTATPPHECVEPWPSTLPQVVYAYPNEYTVGITSLGYQLVWAFFETRPDVSGACSTHLATPAAHVLGAPAHLLPALRRQRRRPPSVQRRPDGPGRAPALARSPFRTALPRSAPPVHRRARPSACWRRPAGLQLCLGAGLLQYSEVGARPALMPSPDCGLGHSPAGNQPCGARAHAARAVIASWAGLLLGPCLGIVCPPADTAQPQPPRTHPPLPSSPCSMLEQLGIPVLAADRGHEHPLVSPELSAAAGPLVPAKCGSGPHSRQRAAGRGALLRRATSACAAPTAGRSARLRRCLAAARCSLPTPSPTPTSSMSSCWVGSL